MTAIEGVIADAVRRPRSARTRVSAKRLASAARRYPTAVVSIVIIAILLATAIAAPVVATHSYEAIAVLERFNGPSSGHWFGTDEVGRDQFSRVIYGARVSLTIGLFGTLLAAAVSGVIGILSGFWGGWVDLVVQRLVDVWMAFPGLIFILFVVSIIGSDQLSLIIVLGLLFGGSSIRIIRSAVISIRAMPYIEAARSTGASEARIVIRHVLPSVVPFLVIVASVHIGSVILAEASLAFLGYGVPPPTPSWGRMLHEARPHVVEHPYLALFPGLAIAASVYAFNMLGDVIRDVSDPRLRGR